MKIKSILAATLLAASVATASAQPVYSVNAVGFVNVEFPVGFSIGSNPLEGATNTVAALFPSTIPNGSTVFKFSQTGGGFTSSTYFFGTWDNPTMSLVPGEAFFFRNSGTATFTNTFVGNVKQGTLATPLAAGFSLVSSQVPQGGLVSTDLALPVNNGDTVFLFRGGNYVSSTFFFSTWDNQTDFPTSGEPVIKVGEGFFVRRGASGSWTRTFSVN